MATLRDEFEANRAQLRAAHEEITELTRQNHELSQSMAHAESKVDRLSMSLVTSLACVKVSAIEQEKSRLEGKVRATRPDLLVTANRVHVWNAS